MKEKSISLLQFIVAIAITITIFILLLFYQGCSNQTASNTLVSDVINDNDKVKYIYLPDNTLIAEKKVLEVMNSDQLKTITSKNATIKKLTDQFKKVSLAANIGIKTVIIDTIEFIDSIPCAFDKFPIIKLNKNYNLYGSIEPKRLILDSLIIVDSLSLVVGRKKVSFLKYSTYAMIHNSNDLVRIDNARVYAVNIKTKWHDKPVFTFIAGVVVGGSTGFIVGVLND